MNFGVGRPTALLRQDLGQIDFGRRRFRLRPGPARAILEESGRSFLIGFNSALATPDAAGIGDLPVALHGFAYEGAGMACALLDILSLSGGRRLGALLAGPAARYPHLVHVGVGWAHARLHLRPTSGVRTVHPLYRWLAFDGYGFHEGFFHSDRAVAGQRRPSWLGPGRRAVYDQGLGRMLWFHECADVESIALRVAEFAPARRADLWSGIGLAATYAGGASAAELTRLSELAGLRGRDVPKGRTPDHRAHLAQGAAFASAARTVSGIVPDHTVTAATVLTGVGVDEAAHWSDIALKTLGNQPHTCQDYLRWRAEIRRSWARQQGENS